MIQSYLVVQNNVVTNDILWDGNTQTWTPPQGATMLVQAETPAIVWGSDNLEPPDWILVEEIGTGGLGYTWDGSVLTTNYPKPTDPPRSN
jgi:hypothetical protein